MSEKEVETEIRKNVLKNARFSWKPYTAFKRYFLDKNQSKTQKLFRATELQIEELNHFLSNEWEWESSTAKDKSVVMKQYKSLYEDYLDLKERVEEEQQSYDTGRAGYTKSFLESM